jgi:hypothetical protein
MNIIGYLVFGYMILGVILAFVAMYLGIRLINYVYIQYPEESSIIKTYEWQHYPGSMFHRTLKALIKKQSPIDPELAQREKWAKWSTTYFLTWFALALIMFFIYLLVLCLK